MGKPGRHSTVATHPAVRKIEADLDAGIAHARISTKYGVSTSAVSRFSLSRNAIAENVQTGHSPVADVVGRLVEAADDAQALRRHTSMTGAPLSRARAIKAETEILLSLIDRLGITDTTVAEWTRDAESMVNAVAQFVRDHPDAATPLLDLLADEPNLTPLADALRDLTPPRSTP